MSRAPRFCWPVATNQVHPVAEFNLALIAEKEANHILAIELYSKAAAAGHTESMVNLGSLLLAQAQRQSETTGYGLRNRRNMEAASLRRAARLYQEAALRGNPRAMYNLAAMTLEGQGIEPNQAVAAQLFGQAAMLGLAEAEPHAPRCAVCGRFAASACGVAPHGTVGSSASGSTGPSTAQAALEPQMWRPALCDATRWHSRCNSKRSWGTVTHSTMSICRWRRPKSCWSPP
jgi:hypothetical protein